MITAHEAREKVKVAFQRRISEEIKLVMKQIEINIIGAIENCNYKTYANVSCYQVYEAIREKLLNLGYNIKYSNRNNDPRIIIEFEEEQWIILLY